MVTREIPKYGRLKEDIEGAMRRALKEVSEEDLKVQLLNTLVKALQLLGGKDGKDGG